MRSVLPALALLLALPVVAVSVASVRPSDHAELATSHNVRIAYASTEGGVEVRAQIPSPRQITAFAILTETGASHVWTNPSPYDGPEGDKPEGERGCPGVTCMEIIDPWTCTCSDPDPWGEDDGSEDAEETEESEDPGSDDRDDFMSFGI